MGVIHKGELPGNEEICHALGVERIEFGPIHNDYQMVRWWVGGRGWESAYEIMRRDRRVLVPGMGFASGRMSTISEIDRDTTFKSLKEKVGRGTNPPYPPTPCRQPDPKASRS